MVMQRGARTLAALCLALALAPGLALADLSASAQALSPSAQALTPTATAQALSPSVSADLAPLPPRPTPLVLEPNVAWEDFSAVTLVSLPFTAFWSILGTLIVGGLSQGKFPPEIDNTLIASAASVAAGASLAIGLVSIHWGGSKTAPPAPLEPKP